MSDTARKIAWIDGQIALLVNTLEAGNRDETDAEMLLWAELVEERSLLQEAQA